MGGAWLLLVMAIFALMASWSPTDETGRAQVSAGFVLSDLEIRDQLDDGHYYYSDRDRWYSYNVLSNAVIFERLSQVADDFGASQQLNISDLGITNLIGSRVSSTLEVNGAGYAMMVVSIPDQIEPTTFVSSINSYLGNQFGGIFDGSDLVSPQGYVLSVPSGFPTTLSQGDVAFITK